MWGSSQTHSCRIDWLLSLSLSQNLQLRWWCPCLSQECHMRDFNYNYHQTYSRSILYYWSGYSRLKTEVSRAPLAVPRHKFCAILIFKGNSAAYEKNSIISRPGDMIKSRMVQSNIGPLLLSPIPHVTGPPCLWSIPSACKIGVTTVTSSTGWW